MKGITARNLMKTHLITIPYSEDLQAAVKLMQKHGIRHLPVVNAERYVVGIISDRDVLRASVPVYGINGGDAESLHFIQGALVRDYMSTALQVISIDDSVNDAIELMLREKVSSCLVAKSGGIVGIITYEDLMELLKSYLDRPTGSLRSTISEFITTSPLGAISSFLSNVGI